MKAFLFPGQGSQHVGMGKDIFEKYQTVREFFEMAERMLGYPITKVMFAGPEEELKRTINAQPALFIHSVGLLLSERAGESFEGVAGHSLGELTALVAAGVLTAEDGLRLVKARAQAFEYACERHRGTMAAVIGMPDENVVREVCEQVSRATGRVVVPANYNAPDQIVISGEVEAVEQASRKLQEAGARRIIPLKVSGAFHSPLMAPAQERFAAVVEHVSFRDAAVPVYQNVCGEPVRDARELKRNIVEQITSPVLWYQTIRRMRADGFTEFVEVGAGSVLTNLLKRIP